MYDLSDLSSDQQYYDAPTNEIYTPELQDVDMNVVDLDELFMDIAYPEDEPHATTVRVKEPILDLALPLALPISLHVPEINTPELDLPKPKRFKAINSDSVQELASATTCQSTKHQTKWAVKLFNGLFK